MPGPVVDFWYMQQLLDADESADGNPYRKVLWVVAIPRTADGNHMVSFYSLYLRLLPFQAGVR